MTRKMTMIVFALAILLASCEDWFIKPNEVNLNMEDFDATWQRVNEVYPYIDYKGINWDSIYTIFRPRAEQARGDEIYTVLIDMLAELRDGHIYLTTDGGEYIRVYAPRRWLRDQYAYDPQVVRNYFDKELKMTGEHRIEYEIMDGNIGYLYLGTFDDRYITDYLWVAMEYIKSTKALILDIRHNNGGSYQNLIAAVGRFIKEPLEKPAFYILGERISDEPFEPSGDFQYTNPIVLLINGVCYSTGDIFPEVMKQLPYVTLVGDTTGGGSSGSTSSAQAEYSLPSGKRIFVGTTDWRGYDGIPLEWRGCAPDIRVEQSEKDINNGIDRQLEFAIDFLSSK